MFELWFTSRLNPVCLKRRSYWVPLLIGTRGRANGDRPHGTLVSKLEECLAQKDLIRILRNLVLNVNIMGYMLLYGQIWWYIMIVGQ